MTRSYGGAGNDLVNDLAGGDDSLAGGSGNDTLSAYFGAVGEKDTLTGAAGSDLFSLATGTTVFYDDGDTTTAGVNDYGYITDFDTSFDFIQLTGQASDYRLDGSPTGLPTGTGVIKSGSLSQPAL